MHTTLRSLWMWFACMILILVWVPFLGIIRLFDRDPVHYRTGYWFRRLGARMVHTNPTWIPKPSGIENVTDPRRPYVFVCNHLSNVDIPIVSTLPWEMKWLAKAEMFKWPLIGWLMRWAGDIPVNRKDRRSGIEAMIKAKWYLEHQCSVMFFPEGTRSRDGRLGKFKDGAFRIAIKTQVPILPLILEGTQNCLPKHDWKFGNADEVKLKLLAPIETTGLTTEDVPALRDKVRTLILHQMAEWQGVKPADIDALIRKKPTHETT